MNYFSEAEFGQAMYSNLVFGDETKIAEKIGKSVSIIAQMYSPDAERESNLYKAANELAALIEINETRGCNALQIFNGFVKRAIAGDSGLCVDSVRRKSRKELMEADLAELEGKPLLAQVSELEDAIMGLQDLVLAKKGQINAAITI